MHERKNLLELRALLLTVSDYDHSRFFHCGTPSCALGWAAHTGIGGLRFDGTWSIAGDTEWVMSTEAADKVFGEGAYRAIFDNYEWGGGEPSRVRKWKTTDVIAAIDRFMEKLNEPS